MRYERAEQLEALHDGRVLNALEIALRDARIRRRFRTQRARRPVGEVIDRLAEDFFLIEERVRTIVYRKGM